MAEKEEPEESKEEETDEEKKAAPPAAAPGNIVDMKEPTAADDKISAANAAAARQEKANEDLGKLLDRQEAMQVEKTLGGTAEAGKPSQTEEEKEIAAAKKMIAGTGFEEDLFPDKKDGTDKKTL